MGKLDKVKVQLKKLDPPGNFAWLAKKIDVSPALLSRYNNGQIGLLYEHKIRIANLFRGITVEDLFG